MPRHTIFERIKPHARRAADAAKKAGTRGFEAGKRGFDTLRGKASAGVEEVKLKTGSAANRANARVASGERPSFSNRTSNTGPAPEPAGGRVKGGGARSALRGGIRTGTKALRRFGPGGIVASIAADVGLNLGEAAVTPESLLAVDEGKSVGARNAKFFGLSGAGELDPFGNPTIDALNAPDMVRPSGNSGGFFSTDARSLNPNRFVEELDQGPSSLNSPAPALTRDQLLTGQQFDPNRPNVPLGGPRTEDTETNPSLEEVTEGFNDPNNQRQSLRDALAGFERTDNALGDAMALNARLGLSGAFNKGLGDRNKFGLDQKKFGLEENKFAETQRQNDFTNAIDLNTANLENLAAQGDITEAEAKTRVRENTVFKDLLANAETPQAKKDITFTEARKTGFDLESAAGQSMLSIAMRELQQEEDSGFGKFLNAITPFVSDPFGSVFDSADGPAPLLGSDTIKDFTIKDGAIYADKEGKGVQSYMLQLSDLSDTTGQFLKSVIGRQTKKKTLR